METILQFGELEWRARGGQDLDGLDLLQAIRQQGMELDDDDIAGGIIEELRDRMQRLRAEHLNEDAPDPRPFTIRWYQKRRNKPIASGSTVTVLQASYCMAWLKMKGNMTSSCLDTICRLLASGGMLPVLNNIMPRYCFLIACIAAQLLYALA